MRRPASTSRSSSASRLGLALVLVAACDKKPATTEPKAGSAATPGSADPCPPSIDAHVKTAMDATDVYFTKLSAVMQPWTDVTSCDEIRAALEPLAADGDAYVEVVESAKSWAKDLSEACRDSLDAKWAGDRAKGMELKFRGIIDGGLPHVKRCESVSGVKETAERAIRLMKKKR